MNEIYGGDKGWYFSKKWNKFILRLPKEEAGEFIKAMCALNEGEKYAFKSAVLEALFEMITGSEA